MTNITDNKGNTTIGNNNVSTNIEISELFLHGNSEIYRLALTHLLEDVSEHKEKEKKMAKENINFKREADKWMKKYYSTQSTAEHLAYSNENLKRENEELRIKIYHLESEAKMKLVTK
jgi:HD superfamily phosphohydrolase